MNSDSSAEGSAKYDAQKTGGWYWLVQTRSGHQFVCKEMTETLKAGWLALIPIENESKKISFSGPLSENAFWITLNAVEIREDAVDWVAYGFLDKS